MSTMETPQVKRIVKVDVHVLAYLGDYLKTFKERVRKTTMDMLNSR